MMMMMLMTAMMFLVQEAFSNANTLNDLRSELCAPGARLGSFYKDLAVQSGHDADVEQFGTSGVRRTSLLEHALPNLQILAELCEAELNRLPNRSLPL